MYSKIVVVLGLIAAVAGKDLIVGTEGGYKIFEENVTASPTIWKLTNNYTVSLNDSVISMIVVTDDREDKSGEVKILDGGVGHSNVTFELKSPAVFRGYYFNIKLYSNEAPEMPELPETGPQQVPEQQNNEGIPPQQTGADQSPAQVPQVNEQDPEQNAQVPQQTGFDSQAAQTNQQVPNNGQQPTQIPQLIGQETTAIDAQESTDEPKRQNRDTQQHTTHSDVDVTTTEVPTTEVNTEEASNQATQKPLTINKVLESPKPDSADKTSETQVPNQTQQNISTTTAKNVEQNTPTIDQGIAHPVPQQQTTVSPQISQNTQQVQAQNVPIPYVRNQN